MDVRKSTGRIPYYTDPDVMQSRVDEYFETELWPTMAGLARYLGFCDRHSLFDYEYKTADGAFSHVIKDARSRLEEFKERLLMQGEGSAAGIIFSLKNHHGYVDKTEVDQKISGDEASPLQFVIVPPKTKSEPAE